MIHKFEKINSSRLKQMINNDIFYKESLSILLKNLALDLNKIKHHLEKKEYKEITDLCHKMKTSTYLISLDNIENEMKELSERNNKLDEVNFIKYTQKIIQEIDGVLN